KQQPVETEHAAVVEDHPRCVGVDTRHGGTGLELDVMLGVEAVLVHVGLLAQIVLGQRRALVRALGLGAEQDHPPVETPLAQLFGRLGAREARADDDESLFAHCILAPLRTLSPARARARAKGPMTSMVWLVHVSPAS